MQKVCDATLDIIAQIDDRWAERVQREKFQVKQKFNVYFTFWRLNAVGPPCHLLSIIA